MFSINLKSLFNSNYFKVPKNGCYIALRSITVLETPAACLSSRHFSTKLLTKKSNKPVRVSTKVNNIIFREIVNSSPKSIGPIRWRNVAIVAVFGSAFYGFMYYLKNKKLQEREAHRKRELGKAALGGKFDLVDQDNKRLTSDDLLGNWVLLYFGFTHCPDICPDELEKIVEVVNIIEKNPNIKNVTPVFITVDPERDTPNVIKKYLKEFSDKIIGLTGTVEQIAAACKSYRVYYSPGPKDSDADYIVDHSIIMYLIDPEGNFIDYYGQNRSSFDIVNSISFNQKKQEFSKSNFEKFSDFLKKIASDLH